ncbi:hypothetical protein ACFVJ8_26125 [Streptomyces yangpuensis]|uniref:hypothetical protein n=1 Tax=Streptomyces TaxID=1883 RepID=UPI00131B95A8|nr:hypothetical protein [Streptomyces sp. NRRL S-378]
MLDRFDAVDVAFDARVIRSGVEDRVIREDEALRDRARALLAACTDPVRTVLERQKSGR